MRQKSSRRLVAVSLVIMLLAMLGATVLPQMPTAGAVEGFPVFIKRGTAVDADTLANGRPGDGLKELIFPSVIRASDYLSTPLDTYYMYYAPHEQPGGIYLATAPSPTGPWTPYSATPLIPRNWVYNSTTAHNVSHISSAHVIWIDNKLYLYYHGENNVTRLATSTDGVNFVPYGVVMTASRFNSIATEASYARIFRYTIPGYNNTYIMLLMVNHGSGSTGTRKLHLAWSDDGKAWTVRQAPLISPASDEGGQLSSPYYFPWNGRHYVVYHSGSGYIHATEVGADFSQEVHKGAFFDGPDARDAAPTFYTSGDTMYMYYEAGTDRLHTDIAWASANLNLIVLDNGDSTFSTTGTGWTSSTGGNGGFWGSDFLHDGTPGVDSGKTAKWIPNIRTAGNYNIYMRWSAHANRPDAAPLEIKYNGGSSTDTARTVNQTTNGGTWVLIGNYYLTAGTGNYVMIKATDSGYTVADAVKFERT